MPENTASDYIRESLFPDQAKEKRQAGNEKNMMFSGDDLKKLAQKISSQQSEKPGQARSRKKWNAPGRQ